MNTDQRSQFTAGDLLDVLHEHAVAISMDGKANWRDNVHQRLREVPQRYNILLPHFQHIRFRILDSGNQTAASRCPCHHR